MRDLKVALIERSRAERVSVSSLVRAYVATGLGRSSVRGPVAAGPALRPMSVVKLSIRMPAAEAGRIAEGARQAGISRAAYLAELVFGAPQGVSSATRSEQVAMLASTNAELATLGRNVRHLATLISQGSGEAALHYKGMLNTITVEVRRHLSVSSAVLADLRSRRLPASPPHRKAHNDVEGCHG